MRRNFFELRMILGGHGGTAADRVGTFSILGSMLDAVQCVFLHWFSRRYAALTRARKLELFRGMRGQVLEVGAGTAVNFDFIPSAARWTGVDPNAHGLRYIQEAARGYGREFEFRVGCAEALPFPDASFDFVACTLTLCSVKDPGQALKEIRRVLRPGGQLLFMEHVAAPEGTLLLRKQRMLRPVFRCLAGCRPDQDTGSMLKAARFSAVQIEEFALKLPIVGPHICGHATR